MEIQENVLLGPLTTLKIGGPARYFVRVEDELDLWEAVHRARELDLPVFILGGGSNLVVRDSGFSGMVIHIAMDPSIVRTDEAGAILFDVSAGTDWNDLVFQLCQQGISGMECLAGIPGLVGGAPIQNIGAYGQEVAQTIQSVRVLDLERLAFGTLTAEECRFGYRTSIFNSTHRGRYVVTAVHFRLSGAATPKLAYADLQKHFAGKGDPAPIGVYEAVRAIRAGKGMLIDAENQGPDSRSAGSFFKNPVVAARVVGQIAEVLGLETREVPHWPATAGEVKLPAAWLIEHSGFQKGFVSGRVGISSRHTLALINRTGDARCEDLLRLRDLIVMTVEDRFRVTLEQEPVLLG